MHRYLRTVKSFQRVAHLAKKCDNATAFRTICGETTFRTICVETKKTKTKFFGISEAKLLTFDCVNLFSLQGQCRVQFRLISVFPDIEFYLVW